MAPPKRGVDPYRSPARPRPGQDLKATVAQGDDAPGYDVVIPADTIKPEPRQQVVGEGETVWIHGPEGENPKATGRMPPAATAGMLVEIGKCLECGDWYPREARPGGLLICLRCYFSRATGIPPLDDATRTAMEQLRWRLNDYRRWRERDRAKEHDAFVNLCHDAYLCGPALLAHLERLYGDQVVRGVKDIAEAGE